MPLRTRVVENARTAYIEVNFAQEARRRNYDANALLQKPKKNDRRKRVVNYLSRQFARLPEDEKRLYQYLAEKKWPLKFERCNGDVYPRHVYPDPERVVQFDLDHFTSDKTYDAKRNQFIAEKRGVVPGDELKDLNLRYIRAILRARGHLDPKTPAAPVVPDNTPDPQITPQEHALARSEARKERKRLGSAPGLWKFHKVLYRRPDNHRPGFQVLVALFRLTDGADRTMSTIVIKRERRPANLAFNPGAKGGMSKEEGDVHKLLYAACPQYVVGFIHQWYKHDREDNYLAKRIVTDWIPHGSLWSFIRNGYRVGRHLIPEPFIWYCFKALTEVALVCWNGHAGRFLRPGWEHIVNTDIKASNVWLDRPDPAEPMVWARRYPKPKVGDFGMAWRTYHGLDDRNHAIPYRQRRNPPDFNNIGTPGHMPPELLCRNAQKLTQSFGYNAARVQHTVDRLNADLPQTPLPWPNPWPANVPRDNSGIHSWTMVWEIGMVIWCMISTWADGGVGCDRTQPNDIMVDFSQVPGGADVPPRENFHIRKQPFHLPLRPAYSGRLVELVYQCLTFSPPDRIGLEDLWDEVMDGCDDVGDQYAGRENDPPPDGPNPVSFLPDKYPLGQNVLNDS